MDLSQIISPDDIRNLKPTKNAKDLADDIRTKIIQTVSKNGGHLSSNLGIVEITLALHRVFHMPEDKIIFDVGHQTYTHAGRRQADITNFIRCVPMAGFPGFPSVPKAPMTALKPATPLRLFRLRSAWRAPATPGAKNIM